MRAVDGDTVAPVMGAPRRSLRRDQQGLSTTEYVILLMIVACVGVGAWRIFGSSAVERANAASGNVGALEDGTGGGGGGGHGGGRAGASGPANTRLEDATADATPPPEKEDLSAPYTLFGVGLLLLVLLVARRMKSGDGGKGGEGGGEKS